MAEIKVDAYKSPVPRRSSDFVASIVSPTTVRLTIRKSRSTSAMLALQREAQQGSHPEAEGEEHACAASVRRSRSLPSELAACGRSTAAAVEGACVRRSEGGLHLADERGKGFATGGETTSSKLSQLEEETRQSKSTVATLERTILHMKAHIQILEGQLDDEAQNSSLLKEELEASRRLCCQLHLACSRGDVAQRSGQSAPSPADLPSSGAAVEHRFVQTLPSSEGAACLPTGQDRSGLGSNVKACKLPRGNIRGASEWHYDKMATLENEVTDLQQECKNKDYQVTSLTQQLSTFIHRSTKLEAEQVSLRESLRRANSKVERKEGQLVCSQKLLDEALCEVDDLRQSKGSLSERCVEWEKRATAHREEVTSLKDELRHAKQQCRTLCRRIAILSESLESTQGKVTEKETALETKNTILEAIKTIAYTTPSPSRRASSHPGTPGGEAGTPCSVRPRCGDATIGAIGPRTPPSGRARRSAAVLTAPAGRPSDAGGREEDESGPVAVTARGRPQPLVGERCRAPSPSSSTNGGQSSTDSDRGDSPADGSAPDTPTGHRRPREARAPGVLDSRSLGARGSLAPPGSYDKREEEEEDEGSYGDGEGDESGSEDVGTSEEEGDDEEEEEDEEEREIQGTPSDEVDVKYGVEAEGLLLRKQELANYAMKSRDRSWHYAYIVQHGTLVWFYETRDHKIRGKTLGDEPPVDLRDAYVSVAMEYTRKKHIFRVQLTTGQQFLFQARDDREMLYWVCCMDSAARCQTASTNGIPPSIGAVAAPTMGSPSKSDRLKRAIKGGLSALTK